MSTEPVPLSEIIADMPEDDRAWVRCQSAQLIAEERARRAVRGEPRYLGERETHQPTQGPMQGANDADV